MRLPASKKLESYLSISVGATVAGAAALADAEVLVWNGPPVTKSLQAGGPPAIQWSITTMTASLSFQRYNNVPSDFFVVYTGANYIYINTATANGKAITNDSKAFARLSAGDTVGPASNWGTPQWTYINNRSWTYSSTHPWATGTDNTQGFIGFYLAQGADRNYGWAQFTYDNGPSQSITLTSFAYQTTPNTAITIESVPEPTTLGLMVSGAAGIAALRRRRKLRAA